MKVLVTGATGFVGAVLVPELVARHGAGAVDAFVLPGDVIPATWRDSGVRLFRGDIADAGAVRAAVSGHDRVIHMAGLISYWKGDEEKLRQVNEDGTRAVVEAALAGGVERLVHISSVGAIGFHEDGTPADETTRFNWPADILYMGSKRRGQDIVERAVRESGLRAVILNPASIMGPGDHNPATPHNELYKRICGRTQIGSFAGGLAIVDVRDLAAVILEAVEGRGRDGEC
ncbi:MAG: hopanoid-associated sugar epimerase, partial [Candidatus Aminicenantes bacterium]|nr:hopanoid-associated sugar epimerase [Candidatus Aminicenantes bacterium]